MVRSVASGSGSGVGSSEPEHDGITAADMTASNEVNMLVRCLLMCEVVGDFAKLRILPQMAKKGGWHKEVNQLRCVKILHFDTA
jgi:hypothetical protein